MAQNSETQCLHCVGSSFWQRSGPALVQARTVYMLDIGCIDGLARGNHTRLCQDISRTVDGCIAFAPDEEYDHTVVIADCFV
jgi:hypothetical protein